MRLVEKCQNSLKTLPHNLMVFVCFLIHFLLDAIRHAQMNLVFYGVNMTDSGTIYLPRWPKRRPSKFSPLLTAVARDFTNFLKSEKHACQIFMLL